MDQELILAAQGVRYRYPGATGDALGGVSLTVRRGDLVAVLGPNGSGKTTLLRVALGALVPAAGSALVAGRPAAAWTRRELARLVGVVPQREETVFPQRVREAVLLGRYPHLSMFGAERPADHEAVNRALAQCDAGHLAGRWMATLSGGEYQRVRVARALAQEPRLLVLDEPTMSLDVRHEMELFELVRGLVDRSALAVVLVTHHVNLAARFADRVLLLDGGRAAGEGAPAEVLTRETVEPSAGDPTHDSCPRSGGARRRPGAAERPGAHRHRAPGPDRGHRRATADPGRGGAGRCHRARGGRPARPGYPLRRRRPAHGAGGDGRGDRLVRRSDLAVRARRGERLREGVDRRRATEPARWCV